MVTTKNDHLPDENARLIDVIFADEQLRVTLKDGREIATPLAWYPRLQAATDQQRNHYELSIAGVYWPDVDEDLSVAGMLRGVIPPQTKTQLAE